MRNLLKETMEGNHRRKEHTVGIKVITNYKILMSTLQSKTMLSRRLRYNSKKGEDRKGSEREKEREREREGESEGGKDRGREVGM